MKARQHTLASLMLWPLNHGLLAAMPASAPPATCPCGSNKPYAGCCGPLHAGVAAASAEALMRSRYSAYVLGNEAYLLATWHVSTRPAELALAAEAPRQWLGLDIRRCSKASGQESGVDVVEFVARFKINGRAFRLHETSNFVQEHGRWFYRDGVLHER